MDIPIWVYHGDKIHFCIIYEIGDRAVYAIIFQKVIHVKDQLRHRTRLTGMMKCSVEHLRLILVNIGIIGNPEPVYRVSVVGSYGINLLTGRDKIGKLRGHCVQVCEEFGIGEKPSH